MIRFVTSSVATFSCSVANVARLLYRQYDGLTRNRKLYALSLQEAR